MATRCLDDWKLRDSERVSGAERALANAATRGFVKRFGKRRHESLILPWDGRGIVLAVV